MNIFVNELEICKNVPDEGAFIMNNPILNGLAEIKKISLLLNNHFISRNYKTKLDNFNHIDYLFGEAITWKKCITDSIEIYIVVNIERINGNILNFDEYINIKKDSLVRGIYHSQNFNL